MKAFKINRSSFVGHTTKYACCGVLKDQWLAIAVGFVISLLLFKSTRFHDQTPEDWEFVDAIRSKKHVNLGAISAFGPSSWPLLGPPLTAYYKLLTFLDRKKVSLVHRAISASKLGTQKVTLHLYLTFHLVQISKRWGALSFYGRKVGYM